MLNPVLTWGRTLGFLGELCHLLSVSFSSLWLSNYVTWVLRILARERFCRMVLTGEVLAAPAIMCHKQSNSLNFPLIFKESWDSDSFKDWSSICISFECSVVDCSADLSFPGCMRKQQDDRDILIAWRPWTMVFSLLYCFLYHGFARVWWTDCQDSLKCWETFSNFMYLVLILLVSSVLKFLTLFWLVSRGTRRVILPSTSRWATWQGLCSVGFSSLQQNSALVHELILWRGWVIWVWVMMCSLKAILCG